MCPKCKANVPSDEQSCSLCGHEWGECKPAPDEPAPKCSCCLDPIDMDLRKDNPLCDRCSSEAHVDGAMRAMEAAIARMGLPFQLSIAASFRSEYCRITKTFTSGYAITLVNSDRNLAASGHARTVNEASDKALTELKSKIEQLRAQWAA